MRLPERESTRTSAPGFASRPSISISWAMKSSLSSGNVRDDPEEPNHQVHAPGHALVAAVADHAEIGAVAVDRIQPAAAGVFVADAEAAAPVKQPLAVDPPHRDHVALGEPGYRHHLAGLRVDDRDVLAAVSGHQRRDVLAVGGKQHRPVLGRLEKSLDRGRDLGGRRDAARGGQGDKGEQALHRSESPVAGFRCYWSMARTRRPRPAKTRTAPTTRRICVCVRPTWICPPIFSPSHAKGAITSNPRKIALVSSRPPTA